MAVCTSQREALDLVEDLNDMLMSRNLHDENIYFTYQDMGTVWAIYFGEMFVWDSEQSGDMPTREEVIARALKTLNAQVYALTNIQGV